MYRARETMAAGWRRVEARTIAMRAVEAIANGLNAPAQRAAQG
jgi:hypothetical protein